MANDSSASAPLWPVEAAQQALFEWAVKRKNGSAYETCQLVYDATHHYLSIVSATDPTIVHDTVDIDDMIGADIAINMTTNEPIRAIGATTKSPPTADSVAVDTQGHATLTLYAYPRKNPATVSIWHTVGLATYPTPPLPTPHYQRPTSFIKYGPRLAHHRVLRLCPSEDLVAARTVLAAVQGLIQISSASLISSSSAGAGATTTTSSPSLPRPSPRHYLVIVNPRSGPKRNAVALAERHVLPMLHQAGIETTVCPTTHYRHAYERCLVKKDSVKDGNEENERDLVHYDGIVVMGGDGSLHEVLNGICQRHDAHHILSKTPIGIIGCGTANGLATSLAHAATYHETSLHRSVVSDAFYIAKGSTAAVDLSSYQVLQKSAVKNDKDKADGAASTMIHPYTSFLTFTYGIIAEVDIESERIHWLGHRRYDVWAVVRVLFLRKYRAKFSYYNSNNATISLDGTAAAASTATEPTIVPSVQDPIPPSWTTIDDEIILFWATQVTHPGRTTFLSPTTRVGDGVFTILLVRGHVGRLRLALILLALETGSHVDMPGAEWITCTDYRLEGTGSFNDLDGEVIENGPIQGTIQYAVTVDCCCSRFVSKASVRLCFCSSYGYTFGIDTGHVMPKAVRVFASPIIEENAQKANIS